MGDYREPLSKRFWKKVNIIHDENSCWDWKSGKYRNGYGKFFSGIRNGGKYLRAHRYSYELHFGLIGDSKMQVCHKCDNRLCVRPDHLFLGTAKDNMDDMRAKGRWKKIKDNSGENNPSAKLTWDIVKEIRSKYIPNVYTRRMLSEEYGVSIHLIAKIVQHEVWKEER